LKPTRNLRFLLSTSAIVAGVMLTMLSFMIALGPGRVKSQIDIWTGAPGRASPEVARISQGRADQLRNGGTVLLVPAKEGGDQP